MADRPLGMSWHDATWPAHCLDLDEVEARALAAVNQARADLGGPPLHALVPAPRPPEGLPPRDDTDPIVLSLLAGARRWRRAYWTGWDTVRAIDQHGENVTRALADPAPALVVLWAQGDLPHLEAPAGEVPFSRAHTAQDLADAAAAMRDYAGPDALASPDIAVRARCVEDLTRARASTAIPGGTARCVDAGVLISRPGQAHAVVPWRLVIAACLDQHAPQPPTHESEQLALL